MKQEERSEKLFEPFQLPAGNPMENWKMDEMFITQALMQAETAEIVSFDIFDTALTRLLNSPVDAFAEVERRLLDAFGKTAKGFAAAREQAEQIARRRQHEKNGAEEITFSQIYAELPALLPKFAEIATAAEVERFVEKQLLQAVPDILELTHRLTTAGKPWVFVSDMYLPEDFLAEILESAGYTGWQALYVSSEIECTKASGNIWDILIPEDQPQKKWLHIGDDQHADIETPKKKGIRTLAYRRVISDRRVGSKLDSHLLPFSRFKRHLDLQDAAQNTRAKSTEQFWYRLGQIMGGMTLAHFIQWLTERVQLHRIEDLYFCARDGYLMKRAWEVSGLADSIPVKTHYLYVSRAALNIVSGMRLSRASRLDPEFIDFLSTSNGKTKMQKMSLVH